MTHSKHESESFKFANKKKALENSQKKLQKPQKYFYKFVNFGGIFFDNYLFFSRWRFQLADNNNGI